MQTDKNPRPLVAVIDDDPDIRTSLSGLLEENGFACIATASGHGFLAHEGARDAVLAIVDLRLEGESGLAVATRLRAERDMPIIMLTGAGTEVDKIVGLETGADDYVTKPFNPRELIARVRAVLRRYGHVPAPIAPSQDTAPVLQFGEMALHMATRSLQDAKGDEIPLTNAEYRLLEFFLHKPDEIVPRVQLLEEMGSDHTQYVDRTIDVLILRLRRKIEAVPSKPVHLQTRRGQGYIFVPNPQRRAVT